MRRICLDLRTFQMTSRFCSTAATSASTCARTQTVGDKEKSRKFERRKLADTFGTLRSFEGKLMPVRVSYRPTRKNISEAFSEELEGGDEVEEIGWTANFLRTKLKESSKEMPIITQPVAFGREHRRKTRKRKEAEEEYERLYGVDRNTAKIVIQCARKEYNHYEGMRYPPGDIQLVSEHWVKSKYKNDWFSINPVARKNPSFSLNEVFSWDEITGLLDPAIIENARKLGFRMPTVIQHRAFRVFKSDAHILIAAETGSGKTVAYAAPLLSTLMQINGRHGKGIVLVPTHALRMQTSQIISKLAEGTGMKIVGNAEGWRNEKLCNEEDWNILVTTPGFPSEFLNSLNLDCVILDEADMLLDESFLEDITRLLGHLKIRHSVTSKDTTDGTRLVFSSATYPDALQRIAESIVADEHLRCVKTENLHRLMPHIKQTFIRIREIDKLGKLKELIEKGLSYPSGQTLTFCKDSKNVKLVSASLREIGVNHAVLYGGCKNESLMGDILKGAVRVIVATDVASRGLDLPQLRHVINFDFPRQLSDYIHRCGRIGRVGSLHKCLMTSFVRRAWEVKHVNTIELAARREHPLEDIELNDPARLRGLQRDLI